ncbi:hypothetical protein SAMN05428970_2025 [Agromyces sp. CF514]|uniref:hypothetical protein n=1 Tax=Agromyces sp. CF514 TaxID=1881031 RepID=UPI0008E01D03|nr:hypothetical protein [Agromyces sp. CF514]SFR76176.1 hypothetical protein SAMN05428970_2025 [Agromyces sp. CF514]
MSGGYQRGRGDGLDVLIQDIREIQRRLRELEIPSGTQNASLVAQVQAKLAELDATVEALVAAYVDAFTYNTSEIDAKVASPGNIAPGNVTASGTGSFGGTVTTGGDMNAAGYIRGGNVYGNILSVDYRNVYVTGVDGALGHVPSSRRYKQDESEATFDAVAAVDSGVVKWFRYIAAVDALGEDAPYVLGGIAEQFAQSGLAHTVGEDAEGLPESIEDRPLLFTLMLAVQQLSARVRTLEAD